MNALLTETTMRHTTTSSIEIESLFNEEYDVFLDDLDEVKEKPHLARSRQKELGISRERVRQLEVAALKKLRAKL